MSIKFEEDQEEKNTVLMPPAWAVPTFVNNFEATRFQQGMLHFNIFGHFSILT